MFLDLPHRAGRYYGTLKQMIGSDIFIENHDPMPYYTSAFAYYRGEYLFRSGYLDSRYRKFRYHTLMILRYQIAGSKMPLFNSSKMSSYCGSIVSVLSDEEYPKAFEEAIQVLDDLNIDQSDADIIKTQSITESIIDYLAKGS